MDLSEFLQQFGLTETESGVYMEALQHEHVSVKELSDLIGLKRPRVYHALETLEQKGLVRVLGSRKVKRFRAEPPEQLKTLLKRKEIEIVSLSKKLDKALPKFPTQRHGVADVSDVEYFRGAEGVKNLAELHRRSKAKEVFALNPSFSLVEKLVENEYGLSYLKERAKMEIKTKTIWQDLPTNPEVAEHDKLLREMRLAPVEKFGEFQSTIIIFDNSVVTINYLPEVFGFHVKSHSYAVTMKSVWQNIWDKAMPVDR